MFFWCLWGGFCLIMFGFSVRWARNLDEKKAGEIIGHTGLYKLHKLSHGISVCF